MKSGWAGICLLVLLGLAVPRTAAADEARITGFRLENGMDALVIVDHRAAAVTQMVWYRIGGADDPRGKSGIAHFLEHLMFKGTDDRAEGEMSRLVAATGGSDNASTSHDFTAYYQRVAAEHLPLMMEMEADRMRDLILSEDMVNRERGVIVEERHGRVDSDPGGILSENLFATQFLNHPYGIPVIGWRHEIEGLSRGDALNFYRTYYAPNNAILVVAGDVDPVEVEVLANQYYGPLAPSDLPERVRVSEPPQLAARRVVYEDARVRQPYVIRNYIAAPRLSGDQTEAAALTILAELLGGGTTSLLYQRLVIDTGSAIDVGAQYRAATLGPATFTVYAVPADGRDLQAIEAQMDAVLAGFLRDGPDLEHLARVRTQLRAAEIYALDNQSGLAWRYGAALSAGLSTADVSDWPAMLASVTAADVMAAARAVLNLRQSATGWLRAPDAGASQ